MCYCCIPGFVFSFYSLFLSQRCQEQEVYPVDGGETGENSGEDEFSLSVQGIIPACGDVAGGADWVTVDVLLLQNCVLFLVFELVRWFKLKICLLFVF